MYYTHIRHIINTLMALLVKTLLVTWSNVITKLTLGSLLMTVVLPNTACEKTSVIVNHVIL